MADQVLYSGVACITDLIVKEGLINLDYADVRAVMRERGKAMMGMGEASGEKRVLTAAEAAISNPLIEDPSIKRASGLLISITGGKDLTLFEVDEAATRIREQADQDANIIVGATFDDSLEGTVRVSVVATGIDNTGAAIPPGESAFTDLAGKLRNDSRYNDRAAPPTTAEDVSFRPLRQRRPCSTRRRSSPRCRQPPFRKLPNAWSTGRACGGRTKGRCRRKTNFAPSTNSVITTQRSVACP